VELLAEPREHVPYDHICRLLRVSEHTLKAIEKGFQEKLQRANGDEAVECDSNLAQLRWKAQALSKGELTFGCRTCNN